ncbi:MAG: nucleotide exchange factor GrpE [Desulfurivibrio sp.]|nr:nucleotide exchange factor GrpE [Desulfurivibrio sp.]
MSVSKDEQQNHAPAADREEEAEVTAAADESEQLLAEEETVDGEDGGEGALARQLAEAREELRAKEEQTMRMAAEFENYKKRMQREREAILKYAEEDLLKELLPTLDNLERATEQGRSTEDVTALLEGVEMTHNGFVATLEKFGLKSLAGRGEPFDPNFHEAMALESSDEVPANTVLNEYQKGYMYKDRLLRAAKVVVAGDG